MSEFINNEVIHMLKNGMDPQYIQQIVAEESRKAYSPVFIAFMQDMLEMYHVKRTEIARTTGISQDYLYKLLNGKKKTAEKDYVVAICIAVGMNLAETQHALEINEMPILSSRDLREHILITSISDRKGFFKTNDWLENAGFPLLRVSKDMPQYIPKLTYSEDDSVDTAKSPAQKKRKLKEISREVNAKHCGNAPFDYTYWANIIVEDEKENRFHVQAFFHPEFTLFSTIDEDNYQKYLKAKENEHEEEEISLESIEELNKRIASMIDDQEMTEDNTEEIERLIASMGDGHKASWETVEEFESLDEADGSDFFRYYLEADKATDEKVKEIYAMLTDTINYGVRCGMKWSGAKPVCYAEQYDAASPADKQYFQVIESEDEITFSASHESVFMYLEMGDDWYSAIFGEREEPKYFIEAHSEEELRKLPDVRTRFVLNGLRTYLHQWQKQNPGFMPGLNESQVDEEELETVAQMATWSYVNGDYSKALELNLKLLEMIQNVEKKYGTNRIVSLVMTVWKISNCYERLEDNDNCKSWKEKILTYKDRIYEAIDQDVDVINNAVSIYAGELMEQAQYAQDRRDAEDVVKYSKEIITLLEGRCEDKAAWGTLFVAYIKYAFILDEDNRSDEAIELYEKADEIVRKQHLEDGQFRTVVMNFYNNYAWVLWNRFENTEAIIYYGKAIELAEDSLDENSLPADIARASLEHYGKGLYDLYKKTGKDKEAARLIKRLAKNDIEFEKL